MQDTNEKTRAGGSDPRYQTDELAFAAHTLIECKNCGRNNAPNRFTCMYCGAAIEARTEFTDNLTPKISHIDAEANGINIVARASAIAAAPKAAELLNTLGWAPADLGILSGSDTWIAVARTANNAEADMLISRLDRSGVKCVSIQDEVLNAQLPLRVGAISFADGSIGFSDFNTGEMHNVSNTSVAAIVNGMITNSRTDVLEKRGRQGRPLKLIDESAMTSDEAMLDIYSDEFERGFRINLVGFDFSCLGSQRSLLAVENMKKLAAELIRRCPDASSVKDYALLRLALEFAWPLETRFDSGGLVRTGVGQKNFAKAASTTNTRQMNKFSRLQYLMK